MAQFAEAAVSFLLERIGKLLIEEVKFLGGVGDEAQQLELELKMMRALLKDAEPKQHEAAIVKEWISQSRELAYEANQVLEKFAVKFGSRRRGGTANALKRYVCISMRHEVGNEIQKLKARFSKINKSFQDYGIGAIMDKEGSSSSQQQLIRRTYSHLEDDDFVGLESEVHKLVQQLVNEKMNSVVSISGMGGLGKTTIARCVYNDASVKRYFSGRVWVCVSQEWKEKDILEGILIKLTPENREEIQKLRYEELVRELLQVQQGRRCLFVLDDIWTTDAWEAIKHAFSLKDKGSKILLTSRNKKVAQQIGPNSFHHELRFLNNVESWELLRKKALQRRWAEDNEDIQNMEKIGRKVAELCAGLPLAVVVLGGILATKSTSSEWDIVYQNILSNLGKGKGNRFQHEEVQKILDERVQKILGLSYNDLPYRVQLCFLYLGSFPEDSEIDAEKICQLWLAEGFVAMMDEAEFVLGELGERCMVLVKVAKFPTSRRRRFESCRLHDLMRDLCLLKAKEENFMRVINYPNGHGNEHGNEMVCSSSLSNEVYRLAIYACSEDVHRYVSPEKKMTKHLRMLKLDFSSGDAKKYVSQIPATFISQFKNFRVLCILSLEYLDYEVKGESNGKFKDFNFLHVLGKLIQLRYLSLTGCRFPVQLPSFGNLIHLQTLDLRAYLEVGFPNTLRNLGELKHLYMFYQRPNGGLPRALRLDGLRKLEILENFTDSLCKAQDLFKLVNLRVLIVTECFNIDNLAAIADYISHSNSLEYTSIFVKTLYSRISTSEKWPLVLGKLLCARSMQVLRIAGPVGKFPKYEDNNTSAAGIVKIELYSSRMKGDPMEILEKLPNLHDLKLESVDVKEMVCHATGFPQLRCLKLQFFDNLRRWIVEKGAMPNLSTLVLYHVRELNKLPDGLKVLKRLKDIQCHGVPESLEEEIKALPKYSSD